MFPIGEMNTAIYPVGTNVGFFDNAPGMSILLKVFSPLLPEDFQYLGFWLLFCFLMAAHFTIKIFELYNVKTLYIILGTLLIACNPVLVYRGMHPALTAHFLIIASIYLYLKPVTSHTANRVNRQQLLLIVISALINPYLCFMVAGFNVILPLRHYFYGRLISLKKALIYPVLSLLSVIVVWAIIGMVKFGGNDDLEVSGSYSLYGFNLNSLTNSGGFSIYVPKKPYVTPHQYEGYMYLGLGMMLLVGVTLIYFFTKGRKRVFSKKNKYLLPLLILSIAALLFAITNVVTYNDEVLFTYWMPQIILKLGDTFRACGRVAWIPYYCALLFFILIFCKSKIANWIKLPLLAFVIYLQGHDMQHLYIRADYPYGEYDSPLAENKWNAIIPSFNTMITYPPFNNHLLNPMDYQDLSFLALKNHKPISVGYAGRENPVANREYSTLLEMRLREGSFSDDELYITTPKYLDAFSIPVHNKELAVEYLDGYYVLYDHKKKDDINFERNAAAQQKNDSVVKAHRRSNVIAIQEADSVGTDYMQFKIDEIIISKNSIYTKGWAFAKNETSNKGDSVFIALANGAKRYIFETAQIKRPDLTSAFNKEYLEDSGFKSVIFTNGFKQDSLTLCIAIKQSSGKWIHENVAKLSDFKQTSKPIKIEYLPPLMGQRGTIDELLAQNSKVKISGWTAFKDADATHSEIEVVFVATKNKQMYKVATKTVIREDVTQAYNNEYNYNKSGYSVLVDKKDMPKGDYKIGLLVRNTSSKNESFMITDRTITIE